MKLSEVRALIRLRSIEGDQTGRRLSRCLNINDLRSLAKRRLPRAVFEFVDGGADEEITMTENRAAFQSWRFVPSFLNEVKDVDLEVEVLGRHYGAPLGLSPTGITRMIHPAGEPAVARAAASRRLPYALSTTGTTTVEELAHIGTEDCWFQTFALRDKGLTRSLVDRAAASGFRVLEVTVDTAVTGMRERDWRNGLTVPPNLNLGTIADIGTHVGYWTAMLTGPALRFASFADLHSGEDITAAGLAGLFDPDLTWDGLAEIRSWWHGHMLIKGALSVEDAKRALTLGLDGVHLSNHGGRQLDRGLPTAALISPTRLALGDEATIVVDSGIRHGADIAVAIALGADLATIGRPYLYGLAAAGERGVSRALEILLSQLRRTMQLLGVASINELRAKGSQLLTRQVFPEA